MTAFKTDSTHLFYPAEYFEPKVKNINPGGCVKVLSLKLLYLEESV